MTTSLTVECDVNGFAPALVRVTTKSGRELYLCNPYEQVAAAIDAGKPFHAHAVVALKPKDITLNPDLIESAEDVA